MISVCMASYNGGKYIREQIDSILEQLDELDELIISDDGSSDSTIEIINSYSDKRIKLYKNINNHGCIYNFENALQYAKGDYIFLADQDDVWCNNKVRVCLAELRTADLVVHDCYITDDKLNILKQSFFKERRSKKGFWNNLVLNSYVGACMVFKSSVLEYVLPLPQPLLVYHDAWIASLVDIIGNVKFINSPLIYFRRHSANTSQSTSKSSFSIYKKILFRLHLLYVITLRLFCYKCKK